jgi:hypothetical protein
MRKSRKKMSYGKTYVPHSTIWITTQTGSRQSVSSGVSESLLRGMLEIGILRAKLSDAGAKRILEVLRAVRRIPEPFPVCRVNGVRVRIIGELA